MISTPIFDDTVTSTADAISKRAHQLFGIVPYLPHWQIIATYDVKPDSTAVVTEQGKQPRVARAQFDVVYIAEYVADRPMRAHLKIADDCLDPMTDSWYLMKRAS